MKKEIKIAIAVNGRFWAFDIASYLQKKNIPFKLITTYPKFKALSFNINKKNITSFSFIEYFSRGFYKMFGFFPFNFLISYIFDKLTSLLIDKSADVYILWASMSLHTIKKVKKVNPSAIIILERGSAHITEQSELLKKVIGHNIIDKRILKKELKEYFLADHIAISSQFTKNSFLKHNICPEKLFINSYGVDLRMFFPINTTKDTTKFIVGYAGTLSARKNIEGLIRVVKLIKIKKLNIQLDLVGNIDKKTFPKELLQEDFINYMPAIAQKELIHFYNKIDVFVLNSIEDGFGMVVSQALACGTPVITTDNTGSADVIRRGYNGYVIPAFSDEKLQEKIEIIYHLSEDKRNELKQNAVNSVKSGYTWDDYGKRYVEFLNKIVK